MQIRILISLFFSFGVSITGMTQTKWKIQDLNKNVVNLNYGTLPIKKNGKWGLVDSNNVVKVKIEYDSIFALGEGICVLKKGNNYRLINDRFQVLYETSEAKLEFYKNIWKVSTNESEQYLVSIDRELKSFKSYEDYEKYLSDRKFIRTIINSTTSKNSIDTVLKFQDKDSIYLVIQFKDGEQIKTEKTLKFQFHYPYFLSYSTHDTSFQQRIINLEKREINKIEFGTLESILTINNHVNLVVYKGAHCEVIDIETGKVIKTKYIRPNNFGELLISRTLEKNSIEIFSIPKNKLIFSGLANFECTKDYAVCFDTLGYASFINTTGEVFYKIRMADLTSYQVFIQDSEIENIKDFTLILISTKQNKYLLISTKGKVYYEGEQSISWCRGNAFSFRSAPINNNLGQVGYVDLERESLVSFKNFEDIKFITTNLYAVKLHSIQRIEDVWMLIDRNGNAMSRQYYDYIEVEKYADSEEFILGLEVQDSISYYDENLHSFDVKMPKKINVQRIDTIHSELSGGGMLFAKLYDSQTKLIKGIIDFDFNTIYLENVKDIYCNPKGKYFFLITDTGDFGYMRTNGFKLF